MTNEQIRADEVATGTAIVLDGIRAVVDYVAAGPTDETCRLHYRKPGNRTYDRVVCRSQLLDVVEPERSAR